MEEVMVDKQELDPAAETQTRKHRERVSEIINMIVCRLLDRSDRHDLTKLHPPEVEVLSEQTSKLHGLAYMGDEYKAQAESVDMKPFFDHHYANNRHHPQHFPEGLKDMTLIDVVEMLCDWKAASERHSDGNILKSIEKNADRFDIPPVLAAILVNTVKFLSLVE